MLLRRGHSAHPHLVKAKISKTLLQVELNYSDLQRDLKLSAIAVGSSLERASLAEFCTALSSSPKYYSQVTTGAPLRKQLCR